MQFVKIHQLSGRISVPGDKSISHRAVMLGSLAEGKTEVTNFLQGADCLSTIRCFSQMGIDIQCDSTTNTISIHGKGLYGLQKPMDILDVGNSGTTLRLISGILAGQDFESKLTGDASIQKRPMGRVITPLSLMGADIISIQSNDCAPLRINGTLSSRLKNIGGFEKNLHGITYNSPVSSAQVKSSILLAGLYASEPTTVTEPYVSRNHTEIMLKQFGAEITSNGNSVTLAPNARLKGTNISVPGDISSAAYFIAAASIIPNSEIVIENVGVNPTRNGILEVCKMMGADITIEELRESDFEARSNLRVRSSKLHGATIEGSLIPRLIDEIPIIAVMACYAEGETIIKDAAELKVKESNRIDVMVTQLRNMGADITATEDGMIIRGGKPLLGTVINSNEDHRIAMSFAVAGIASEGVTIIKGGECVNISYPNFYHDLNQLVVQ